MWNLEMITICIVRLSLGWIIHENGSLDTSYVRANEIALILAKGIKVKFPAKWKYTEIPKIVTTKLYLDLD